MVEIKESDPNFAIYQKCIHKQARKYHRYNPLISLDDFVQEGWIGLLRAAERYEPQPDCKFLTYAFFQIRKSMFEYAKGNRGVVRQKGWSQINQELTDRFSQPSSDGDIYMKSLVNREIGKLPKRQKDLLRDLFWLEREPSEIRKDFDITRGGVSYLKKEALDRLRLVFE